MGLNPDFLNSKVLCVRSNFVYTPFFGGNLSIVFVISGFDNFNNLFIFFIDILYVNLLISLVIFILVRLFFSDIFHGSIKILLGLC